MEGEQLMLPSLKSSVEKKGKRVTQVITGVTGIVKAIRGIKTETIEQGKFTHFETEDGRLWLINDRNVMFVEVITAE